MELNKIEKIAMDWVIKEDTGLSATEQSKLDKWLSESTVHQEIYEQQRWSWNELDRLAGFHTQQGTSENPNLLIEQNPKSIFFDFTRWLNLAVAAAIIAISFILVGKYLLPNDSDTVANKPQLIVERIESRELDDGSVVFLNRGSLIEVDYNENRRQVSLISGEANFTVAKDMNRPFVVEVEGFQIKAVGTAFNVKYLDQTVDIIVTEGVVAINSSENDSADNAGLDELLNENQRVVIPLDKKGTQHLEIQQVDESVIESTINWKPTLIDFENVPLIEIINEFNRRNTVQMQIIDDSVNDVYISSIFWSDNINGFIKLLEANFGVRAERGEDNNIYLFGQLTE